MRTRERQPPVTTGSPLTDSLRIRMRRCRPAPETIPPKRACAGPQRAAGELSPILRQNAPANRRLARFVGLTREWGRAGSGPEDDRIVVTAVKKTDLHLYNAVRAYYLWGVIAAEKSFAEHEPTDSNVTITFSKVIYSTLKDFP
ncbi:hypothetical protein chiPu_0016793 [Chiloscyllium punctatum]|uniref:Uncharacterized protein n=1 Tax=Chiloscyllium punctatum TaxID=137246 RepID=A0A401T6K5_CHIPU|nr:hypothetical protein [Chiloscyllium punctatum]